MTLTARPAITTLGRFFRRDIQVAGDQVVVRTGPYAAIRHPAYAGNLLMLAGFGIVSPTGRALPRRSSSPFWATCPGSPSRTRS